MEERNLEENKNRFKLFFEISFKLNKLILNVLFKLNLFVSLKTRKFKNI